MNGEWLTLLIGAIVGYGISYLFRMREKSITREFKIYQAGLEYLQALYGFLSILFDLVDGYIRALERGKAQISDSEGFIYLTPEECVNKYKSNYEEFTKFMGIEKKKGSEVFLRKNLAQDITDFWGLASYFYEKKMWDKGLTDKFDIVISSAMGRIENLLGIRKQKLKKPKWLKSAELRSIIKGEKIVRR